MIKNLIAVAMASILITQPPQNTNDGTYYQDVNITETYEYETNEVNSVDDLVVGNIYKVNFDASLYTGTATLAGIKDLFYFNKDQVNTYYYNIEWHYEVENDFAILRSQYNAINGTTLIMANNASAVANVSRFLYLPKNVECYATFYSLTTLAGNGNLTYQNFSESDYLGKTTTTITPVETEGLYNLAYHFLYSRIYTNTELQGMETTLFGTTINMNMWLSHTTAIVIICLLLIVLIKFVLWLFKIVSGGMLWK